MGSGSESGLIGSVMRSNMVCHVGMSFLSSLGLYLFNVKRK